MGSDIKYTVPWEKLLGLSKQFLHSLFRSQQTENFVSELSEWLKNLRQQPNKVSEEFISSIFNHFNLYVMTKAPEPNNQIPGMIIPETLVDVTKTGWFNLALSDYMLVKFARAISDAQQFVDKMLTEKLSPEEKTVLDSWNEKIKNQGMNLINEAQLPRIQLRSTALLEWIARKSIGMEVDSFHTKTWIRRILEGDVSAVLDEIETSLSYILPTGDEESQTNVEKILVMLQGSSDAVSSSRALRLLNSLYAGHLLPYSTAASLNSLKGEDAMFPVQVQVMTDPIDLELKFIFDISFKPNSNESEIANRLNNLLELVLPRIACVRLLVSHPPQRKSLTSSSSSNTTSSSSELTSSTPHSDSQSDDESECIVRSSLSSLLLKYAKETSEDESALSSLSTKGYGPSLIVPYLHIGEEGEQFSSFLLPYICPPIENKGTNSQKPSTFSALYDNEHVLTNPFDEITTSTIKDLAYRSLINFYPNAHSAEKKEEENVVSGAPEHSILTLRLTAKLTPESIQPNSTDDIHSNIQSSDGVFAPGYYDYCWVHSNRDNPMCVTLTSLPRVTTESVLPTTNIKQVISSSLQVEESTSTQGQERSSSPSSSCSSSSSSMGGNMSNSAPVLRIPADESNSSSSSNQYNMGGMSSYGRNSSSSSSSDKDGDGKSEKYVDNLEMTGAVYGRIIVHPLQKQTGICSTEFPSTWSSLSEALHSDPIVQAFVDANVVQPPTETVAASSDTITRANSSSPTSLVPEIEESSHAHPVGGMEQWGSNENNATIAVPSALLLHVSNSFSGVPGNTALVPTNRSRVFDPSGASTLFGPNANRSSIHLPIPSGKNPSEAASPSLIIDFFPYVSAGRGHRRYTPYLLLQMSGTLPVWSVNQPQLIPQLAMQQMAQNQKIDVGTNVSNTSNSSYLAQQAARAQLPYNPSLSATPTVGLLSAMGMPYITDPYSFNQPQQNVNTAPVISNFGASNLGTSYTHNYLGFNQTLTNASNAPMLPPSNFDGYGMGSSFAPQNFMGATPSFSNLASGQQGGHSTVTSSGPVATGASRAGLFTDIVLPNEERWHAPVIQARMDSLFRGPYPLLLHDDDTNEYAALNYRLKSVWDLAEWEMEQLSLTQNVHGVMIKQPLLWGATYPSDVMELSKKDDDDNLHYKPEEILSGKVCQPSSYLPPIPFCTVEVSSYTSNSNPQPTEDNEQESNNSNGQNKNNNYKTLASFVSSQHTTPKPTNPSSSRLQSSNAPILLNRTNSNSVSSSSSSSSSSTSSSSNSSSSSSTSSTSSSSSAPAPLGSIVLPAPVGPSAVINDKILYNLKGAGRDDWKSDTIKADPALIWTSNTLPTSSLPPNKKPDNIVLPRSDTTGYWHHLLVLSRLNSILPDSSNDIKIENSPEDENKNREIINSILPSLFPHPLFMKLTKKVWLKDPNFLFIMDLESQQKHVQEQKEAIKEGILRSQGPLFTNSVSPSPQQQNEIKKQVNDTSVSLELQTRLMEASSMRSGLIPLSSGISTLIGKVFDVFLIDNATKEERSMTVAPKMVTITKPLRKRREKIGEGSSAPLLIPHVQNLSGIDRPEGGVDEDDELSEIPEGEEEEEEDEYVDTRVKPKSVSHSSANYHDEQRPVIPVENSRYSYSTVENTPYGSTHTVTPSASKRRTITVEDRSTLQFKFDKKGSNVGWNGTSYENHPSIYRRSYRKGGYVDKKKLEETPEKATNANEALHLLWESLKESQRLMGDSPILMLHRFDAMNLYPFFKNYANKNTNEIDAKASSPSLEAAITLFSVLTPGIILANIQPGLGSTQPQMNTQTNSSYPPALSNQSNSQGNNSLSSRQKTLADNRILHYNHPVFLGLLQRFYASLIFRRRFPVLSSGYVGFIPALHKNGRHEKLFSFARYNSKLVTTQLLVASSARILLNHSLIKEDNKLKAKRAIKVNNNNNNDNEKEDDTQTLTTSSGLTVSTSNQNKNVIVTISNRSEYENFTYLDYSSIRPLLVFGNIAHVTGVSNNNNNSIIDDVNAQIEEEFEMQKHIVFQIRPITNLIDPVPKKAKKTEGSRKGEMSVDAFVNPTFVKSSNKSIGPSHLGSMQTSESITETETTEKGDNKEEEDDGARCVSDEGQIQLTFVSELMRDNIYHILPPHSTRLLCITRHIMTFPLQLYALQQSINRLQDLLFYKIDGDRGRSAFNYILYSITRTMNSVRSFATVMYNIASRVAIIFYAHFMKQLEERYEKEHHKPGNFAYDPDKGIKKHTDWVNRNGVGEMLLPCVVNEPATSSVDALGIVLPRLFTHPSATEVEALLNSSVENCKKVKTNDTRYFKYIDMSNIYPTLPDVVELMKNESGESGAVAGMDTLQPSVLSQEQSAPLPGSSSETTTTTSAAPKQPSWSIASVKEMVMRLAVEKTAAFMQAVLYLIIKNSGDNEHATAQRVEALLILLKKYGPSLKLKMPFELPPVHLQVDALSSNDPERDGIIDEDEGERRTFTNEMEASSYSSVGSTVGSPAYDENKDHNKIIRGLAEGLSSDSIGTPYISSLADQILRFNSLGPIVFVCPELGKWTTVGGLGVMVDELTQDLAANGADVTIITPYYNVNRKGKTDYLQDDGFKHLYNIKTYVGHEPVECGVHYNKIKGVKLYFLHNYSYFPKAYCDQSAEDRMKSVVLMAKGALELCFKFETFPSLIVTNDWYTGLCAAYGHYSSAFSSCFENTTFFHIVHNLEEDYQGRIWPSPDKGALNYIHHLDQNILVDPYRGGNEINLSRAAFMCSNQWGTVSPTYRSDLLAGSSLSPLLRRFPCPFGTSNGVRKLQRRFILAKQIGATIALDKDGNPAEEITPSILDHRAAKIRLQQKYFPNAVDSSIPVFGFVGRLTEQKGVLLILHTCYALIEETHGRIQFIIGGMASAGDPYGDQCRHEVHLLRERYPNSFWADPNEFFTDGPIVNLGCDYGLMPSLFEPGGIVQMEFFVAGTPVIAFKTGGLKDTVLETGSQETSNGFTFEAYTEQDLKAAVHRAVNAYKDPNTYARLRHVAWNSVIDAKDVAFNWLTEFGHVRRRFVTRVDDVEKDVENLKAELIGN